MKKVIHNRRWMIFGLAFILFILSLSIHIYSVKVALPAFTLTYQYTALGLPYTDSYIFLPAVWFFAGYMGGFLFLHQLGKSTIYIQQETSAQRAAFIFLAVVSLGLVLVYAISFQLYRTMGSSAPHLTNVFCSVIRHNQGISWIPGSVLGGIVGSSSIKDNVRPE